MLPSNFLLYSRLTLVCNTSMSGYILNTGSLLLWKHSLTSPSAGGSIWSLLLLPAALSSVGSYWLSGTLQCSCSTTAWFQSPPGLLRFSRHAALCKTGFVTQLSWFGLCGKQEVGTTNPAVWIYTLVLLHTFFAVCWRLYHIFCY